MWNWLKKNWGHPLVVMGIGVLLLGLTALANRDIYTKTEANLLHENLKDTEAQHYEAMTDKVDKIGDQVQWLYERAGGGNQ